MTFHVRTSFVALTKPSGVTSVEARPPAFSLESMIIHEGPFYRELVIQMQNSEPNSKITHKLTMWFRRLAAPSPVGPAPMTRTSTSLPQAVSKASKSIRDDPSQLPNPARLTSEQAL